MIVPMSLRYLGAVSVAIGDIDRSIARDINTVYAAVRRLLAPVAAKFAHYMVRRRHTGRHRPAVTA